MCLWLVRSLMPIPFAAWCQVNAFCETWLQRVHADANSPTLVATLYQPMLGSASRGTSTHSGPVGPPTRVQGYSVSPLRVGCVLAPDPEAKRSPGPNALRCAILRFFMKSTAAMNKFPAVGKLIFETWFGANTSLRLRLAGLNFAQAVFQLATIGPLKMMAPLFVGGTSPHG